MAGVKDFPHRQWGTLRDLWISHIPEINFSESFPEPTLWNLLKYNSKLNQLSAGEKCSYIEGARESVFREAISLSRKFSYCRKVSLQAATTGYPAWAIVAGYDACFYGAKAFCYLLGIANAGRDSKLFIDLFYPTNYKTGKATYQKYDMMFVHQLSERLTHKVLWEITGRLWRTLDVSDDTGLLKSKLRTIDFEGMSNFRNNLIYDGGFWLDSEKFEHCDLLVRYSNVNIHRAIMEHPDDPNKIERYFTVAAKIHDALVYFLGDIATLAPSISTEVAALENWQNQ